MSNPRELDDLIPGEAKRQREAMRRKLNNGGPTGSVEFFSVQLCVAVVLPQHCSGIFIHVLNVEFVFQCHYLLEFNPPPIKFRPKTGLG